jgi:hypothetical protein
MTGLALAALTACSTGGTVAGTPKTSTSKGSGTGRPTSSTSASVVQGSPATSSATPSPPDVTVSKDDAAAALKAYQTAYNAAEAAADTGRLTKAESGSLLATDQVGIIYAAGLGGDKETQQKQPINLTNPAFYIPAASTYPRGFFATADVVQSGVANTSWLMHLTQAVAGGPWVADTAVILSSGQQWPAFAVGADGLLDYSAIRQDKLALGTVDLAAADRTMLADGNAGQPGSPFLNDEVTTAEQRWVQAESDGVAPATVAETVTTDLSPVPIAVPLKDGGELVMYGTRISLRVSESGHTFNFADQGFAKVAGADHFDDGFTADSIYLVAAVDPADKAAKIQKIGQSGGLVALR